MRKFGIDNSLYLLALFFVSQFVACSWSNEVSFSKIRYVTDQFDTVLIDTCTTIPEFKAITEIKQEVENILATACTDSIECEQYWLIKRKVYEHGISYYTLEFKDYNIWLKVFYLSQSGVVYIKNIDKNTEYISIKETASVLFIDSILKGEKEEPPGMDSTLIDFPGIDSIIIDLPEIDLSIK